MASIVSRIRAGLAEHEPWGHGRYVVRLGGTLAGLTVAVTFHAVSLGDRLATAAREARDRAPEAPERDVRMAALAKVRYALDVDPRDIVWVDANDDLGVATALDPADHARVVFAGAYVPGGARDVFIADVASANGAPVRSSLLRNLTDSPAADEGDLAASGNRVAFVRRAEGDPPAIVILDTDGDDPALTESWPLADRLKDAVTNFQQTGRWAGIHRTELALAATPHAADLSWSGDRLTIDTGDGAIVVTASGRVTQGTALIASVRPMTKSRKATLAWAVDTVRAWIGAEPVEALEYLVFKVTDRYRKATVTEDEATARIAASIAPNLERGSTPAYELVLDDDMTEIDLGWPPPDIAPPQGAGRMAGEGEWTLLVDEDFVVSEPGKPPIFATTFLRTDLERPYSVVYMAAWDPRRLTLHPAAGSIEPKAATGETSPGMVPRDDANIRRLVAGFNGGFQALHGEFGLMEDGTMYLPPKPWGGMFFLLRGARAAVGTWPGPDKDVALYAGGDVYDQDPDGVDEAALEQYLRNQGVVSFRQNLTPLFGHGMVNPYRRSWWGSSPRDLDDPNPVTVRSAICWTRHGHFVYFYGLSTNLDAIVAAMEAAECRYGLHLDMNGGNVGWEFYRIVDASEPELQRLPAGFQAEGPVPGRDDLRFRARALFRGMDIFRFPRYIQREPRDYFYLILDDNLPPPDIEGEFAAEAEGRWSQRGLPVRGFPPPTTFASVPSGDEEGSRVYLTALDPRRVRPARWNDAADPAPFAAFVPAGGSEAVWRGEGTPPFSPDDAVVAFAADPLGLEDRFIVDRWSRALPALGDWPVVFAVRGLPLSEAAAGSYAGAFGVANTKRFLFYAEVRTGDGAALYRALRAAGADRVVGVSRSDAVGWVYLYGGNGEGERKPLTRPELADEPLDGSLAFALSTTPPVIEVLGATEVVPPAVWSRPHTRRLRYFRTEEQRQQALRSY